MEINRDNLLSLIQSGIKRAALSVAGLEKQAAVSKDTVRDFLRGKTQVLRADKLQKILNILEPQHKLYITGYVGPGGLIIPAEPKEQVDCPPGCDPASVVAIRVRGDAMLPVFHDGWIIYYSRRSDLAIPPISGGWQVPYDKSAGKAGTPEDRFASFTGKPCVVALNDEKIILGTLKRSAAKKKYDIVSYKGSGIKNIMPRWAAKIIFIKTE